MSMHIALIKDGVVENIIVSDLEFAQTLGYDAAVDAPDDAFLGQQYVDGQFVPAPVAEPEPVAPITTPIMTKLTFLRRFTQAERIAIRAAKTTDPVIEDADALMQLAEEIDVTDMDTVQYVGYLAQKGFLDAPRPAVILAEQPI